MATLIQHKKQNFGSTALFPSATVFDQSLIILSDTDTWGMSDITLQSIR